jgi:hypothetical protein
MHTRDLSTSRSSTRERSLKAFRIGLVIVGMIGGALLPFVAPEIASPQSTQLLAQLDASWFTIVVNAAYGALAGWAVGALVSHLLGKR